jgi:hypothetical protein
MKPGRAFMLSFVGGLSLMFGAHAALTSLMTPGIHIGTIPTA